MRIILFLPILSLIYLASCASSGLATSAGTDEGAVEGAEIEVLLKKLPDESPGNELAHDTMLFPFDALSEPEVQYFLRHYAGPEKEFLHKAFARGEKFLAVIEGILVEHELPAEISAIAIIESGLNKDIRSYQGAVGLWQFMGPTAREYNLKVGWFDDERRDIYKSTKAAAQLLRNLYRIYGDWYLAWAAYNAGPGNVNRAIQNGGSRNFFYLARNNLLPKETIKYVPKIIAVAYIRRNLKRFGIGSR